MAFSELPATAAWIHGPSRDGLESAAFSTESDGWVAAGSTTAVEGGQAWWVAYEIEFSHAFVTRRAVVWSRSGTGHRLTRRLECDVDGAWTIDGQLAPLLDGCSDVDLESSAFTNTLPLRRLRLAVDHGAGAPAAYVRVAGLAIERLEQRYVRRGDADAGCTVDYAAPAFDFAARIAYDHAGLVLDYPGIARRLATSGPR